MRLPPLRRLHVIQAGIVLAPLAYGTVHPLPVAVFQSAGFLLFASWALGEYGRTRTWGHFRDPLLLAGLGGVALGVVQLMPLPIWLLRLLSPETARWSVDNLQQTGIVPWGYQSIALVPSATLQALLWFAALVAWFAVIQHEARSRSQAKRIVHTMAWTGLGLGLLGLFQLMTNAQAIYWVGLDRSGFYASFVNPNNAAGVLILGAMACAAMGFLSTADKRLLWAMAALITAASAAFTLSRGGMGALAFALAFVGWQMLRLERDDVAAARWSAVVPLFFVISLLTFIVWIGHTEVVGELKTISRDRADLNGRLPLWVDSLTAMWPAFPLFGIGFGNFEHVYPLYRSAPTQYTFTALENEYVHAIIEGGLVGALLLAVFLLVLGKRTVAALGQMKRPGLTLPMVGGLLALLVHMNLDFPLHLGGPALWILTAAAVVSARGTASRGLPPVNQAEPADPTKKALG